MACAWLFVAGCGGGSGSTDIGQPNLPEPEQPSLAAPSIATIDPAVGPPAGGTQVTISGAGFLEGVAGGVEVRFGAAPATQVVVVDDATVTCVSPAGSAEAEVDVVVTNSRGTGALEKGFSYLGIPQVSSDLNNDGVADLIIAAQFESGSASQAGSVFVFYGAEDPQDMVDTTAALADVKLMGAAPNDHFGSAVTSGDINGDGKDDLIVGATGVDGAQVDHGRVYVFFGPLPESGTLAAQQADVVLAGACLDQREYFGSSAAVGDVDGDFIGDLLIGATGVDLEVDGEMLQGVGAAYLFLGADLAQDPAPAPAAVWYGDEVDDELGNAVLLADLNGDDLSEVVVGAHRANPVVPPKKYNAGSVHVFLAGGLLSGGRAADADVVYSGEMPDDEFGTALAAGDMDGDGFGDLMVTAPGSQALGSETGRAYVFLGGAELQGANAADAAAIYSGQQSNAYFGHDVTAADINGDGMADIAIGAPHNSFGANKNGRCYVFLGAPELADGLAHYADVILTGETINGERFSYSLEVIDMNDDALADIVSGAVGNDGGGAGSGRVYVFEGQQVPVDAGADDDDLTLSGDAAEANFGSTISRGQ